MRRWQVTRLAAIALLVAAGVYVYDAAGHESLSFIGTRSSAAG